MYICMVKAANALDGNGNLNAMLQQTISLFEFPQSTIRRSKAAHRELTHTHTYIGALNLYKSAVYTQLPSVVAVP